MFDFASRYAGGLTYEAFLEQHGTDEHRRRWQSAYEAITLTSAQRKLLESFRREMQVLCLAGAWCGDCVYQCPIFDHFARATPTVGLRFQDRDADAELTAELSVCGGQRVPVVVFLNEDGQPVARYGDRTLSRYRQMAAEMLGPSCPTGLVLPEGEALAAIVQDWLNEFERVQLLLRLSPRLREKHGD